MSFLSLFTAAAVARSRDAVTSAGTAALRTLSTAGGSSRASLARRWTNWTSIGLAIQVALTQQLNRDLARVYEEALHRGLDITVDRAWASVRGRLDQEG